jgi:hypothetical protein
MFLRPIRNECCRHKEVPKLLNHASEFRISLPIVTVIINGLLKENKTTLTGSFHACHISKYPFVNVKNPIFSDLFGGGGGVVDDDK